MKPESLTSPLTAPLAHKRKRFLRWSVASLILLGIATGSWLMLQPKANSAAKVSEKPAAKAMPVLELAQSDISLVEARPLQLTLPISGSLLPVAQTTVKAKVGGQLQEVLVREGMPVKRGQVIARLDNAELQARLASQNASVEEAQARMNLANKNNNANQALLKQNYISKNAWDTSQSNVELAQANVKSAKANAQIVRIAIADSVVHAPIDGIISRRHAQAGEKISPDQALYGIVDLSKLSLEAQVPASDIGRIKIGQTVAFKVDGFANRQFEGKVSRINPTTEPGSRAIVVHIDVANADGALKGGMFAKGQITTDQTASAPQIAITSLREQNGNPVVYTIENNKVVARAVQLGLRNEDENLVEVSSGLSSGMRILAVPMPDIKPGQIVKLPNEATGKASNTASTLLPTKG
jgi:membrane fusion protein, multidrug efflux system